MNRLELGTRQLIYCSNELFYCICLSALERLVSGHENLSIIDLKSTIVIWPLNNLFRSKVNENEWKVFVSCQYSLPPYTIRAVSVQLYAIFVFCVSSACTHITHTCKSIIILSSKSRYGRIVPCNACCRWNKKVPHFDTFSEGTIILALEEHREREWRPRWRA